MKELIDYDLLRKDYPCDEVESLLELMVEIVSSTAPTIRIGGDTLPTEAVKDRFWRLDRSHIEYIMDSLKNTTTKIHNIRPVTIGPYYSAAVRHDFG